MNSKPLAETFALIAPRENATSGLVGDGYLAGNEIVNYCIELCSRADYHVELCSCADYHVELCLSVGYHIQLYSCAHYHIKLC